MAALVIGLSLSAHADTTGFPDPTDPDAVPEPGVMALITIGLLLFAGWRLLGRKSRQAAPNPTLYRPRLLDRPRES